MSDPRFFTDERTGCIAVRDRTMTDPDYQGLHPDTDGIVQYWAGRPLAEICPTCGHRAHGGWTVEDKDRDAAVKLCEKLNRPTAGKVKP